MTDLTKYKRKDLKLLEEELQEMECSQKKEAKLSKPKRPQIYTEKITINLTKEEAELFERLKRETGIPKSAIIRSALKKVTLFSDVMSREEKDEYL